jgi:CO/xanthine dehydrogenase Mo-binding subunit
MGAERMGWHDREARGGERPWRRGWGMASQIWGGGGGPPANATVKLLPDGTAEVMAGVQDLGTGTKTVVAQVAAEELGLPLDAVRVWWAIRSGHALRARQRGQRDAGLDHAGGARGGARCAAADPGAGGGDARPAGRGPG